MRCGVRNAAPRTICRTRVVEAESAEEFLERVGPVLLADEARHNLALGTLATVIAHPEIYPIRRYWLVEVDGAVVGAALWTPPYNLILPRPLADGALAALAARIGDDLPGVTAALPEADIFSTAWCTRRGVGFEVTVAQGIYALERVVPIEGVPGAMRPAGEEDRPTVSNWYRAFVEEAVPGGGPRDEDAEARRERTIDVRLGDSESSGIVLWEDEGEVVSLVGFGGETPNGIRVGPVYTPPARRQRGFASALTAGLSAQLLELGGASASSTRPSPTRPPTRSTVRSGTSTCATRRSSPSHRGRTHSQAETSGRRGAP